MVAKTTSVRPWYGGVTLKDIYKEKELGNVRYVAEHWSSKGIADSADAVVTVHGTCALNMHILENLFCVLTKAGMTSSTSCSHQIS